MGVQPNFYTISAEKRPLTVYEVNEENQKVFEETVDNLEDLVAIVGQFFSKYNLKYYYVTSYSTARIFNQEQGAQPGEIFMEISASRASSSFGPTALLGYLNDAGIPLVRCY
jgi:hypothetical protein